MKGRNFKKRQGKRDSDRLSDEDRQRMLQEVQDQQADFGVGG